MSALATARGRGRAPVRLAALARQAGQTATAVEERCELCGEPIAAEHRHVLNTQNRELLCACRACSLLFDRPAAAEGHLRLVPDRSVQLTGFRLPEHMWAALQIPVEMAFFFHSSTAERVMAFYPGPMGATESLLALDAWQSLLEANPELENMAPDTEALLVNRARGANEHWLVPITDCYRLVALIRTHWRGLTGGHEVWQEIERFFGGLEGRTRSHGPRTANTEAR